MQSNTGNYSGIKSFADAFENQISKAIEAIRPRRIVKGRVVLIDKDFVHVNIDYKAIGLVPKEEFYNINGEITVKPGDVTEVYIATLEDEHNQLLLSRERAVQLKIWKEVEDKMQNGGIVTGRVQHKVKGGLQVDIGIPAFLPGSQVDIKPHKNLDKFIGEVYDFKVLKITKDKGNVVVSRRNLLLSEREELRTETLKAIGAGVVMEGTVKNLTDYGAFVDLGGLDGLLHITDICWGHISHPAEKLSVGQKVPVVVISYDQEKERVSLGMKQLTEDPWKNISDKVFEGQRITAKVAGATDFGVYLEIAENIEGLLHVDDISWTKKIKNPAKQFIKGQEVEVLVRSINTEERKIALSAKHLQPNPWETLHDRFPVGTQIKGKVRSITDFGMFIEVEEGIDGLVHVTDFSWTEKFKDSNDIKKVYKRGQEVDAVIIDINAREERLSLGIKQLIKDPWIELVQRYPVGTKVKGPVTAVVDFGVFVQLEEGIDGLIHVSQLGISKGTDAAAEFPVGKEVECEVVTVDSDAHRIGLSIKAARKREQREALSSFNDEIAAPTFGDLLKGQLDK